MKNDKKDKKNTSNNPFLGLNLGLGNLPLLSNAKTRSLSPENPTGEKGCGAKSSPDPNNPDLPHSKFALDLGKGWKVHPFVQIPKGKTIEIANIKGPGVIQHIFMATNAPSYRQCILRFFWDDESNPSVETPLSDFFTMGNDIYTKMSSLVVNVNPTKGMNCYWPMPFQKNCKIALKNDGIEDVSILAYQITYAETEIPENAGYFHAQWRRSTTKRSRPEHIILDGIQGHGHYVGTFLAWTQLSNHWWGEGEIKFFIDGDTEYPTICGTGTEDYFGGAWGFGETYCTPFQGYHQWSKEPGIPKKDHHLWVPRHGLYRWHILDPIRFQRDLRVTIQALGWWPGKYQPREDDIASVAYWYQSEPHKKFEIFPPRDARWPR
jgi:hypothetical protein